jgi:glucose-1-phosphate thymidylyltransferase
VTNKHLLPVYRKPMVFYPIEKMAAAGIEEVLIVTGGPFAGDFLKILGNGKQFGLRRLHYTYQEAEGGIAQALSLAEDFADGDRICVILGDNIFRDPVAGPVGRFMEQPSGGRILLREVDDPGRFGVAEVRDGRVVGIEEKPKAPKSRLAVTGVYLYDETVFRRARHLRPSSRGELEITDVNNSYVAEGSMAFEVMDGWWTDAGTFDSLALAGRLVQETPGMAGGVAGLPGQPPSPS